MRFVNTPYDGIEYLEIPIISTSQRKFFFPVSERLDGKIIRRIDLYAKASGLTPSGRSVIGNDKLVKGYLTVRPKRSVTIYKYPLFYVLNSSGSQGLETLTTEQLNYPVQWDLSFVEFAQTVTLSTSQSLLFIIYYQEPSRKTVAIQSIKYLVNPLLNLFIGNEQLNAVPIEAAIDDVTKTRFNFPHDEKYENIKIKMIKYGGSRVVTPQLKNIITSDVILRKSYLVLRDLKGKEIVNNLPLYYLATYQTDRCEIILNNLMIDWPKSYVQVTSNASLSAGTVFFFTLFNTRQ
jgi:hypothetical protein